MTSLVKVSTTARCSLEYCPSFKCLLNKTLPLSSIYRQTRPRQYVCKRKDSALKVRALENDQEEFVSGSWDNGIGPENFCLIESGDTIQDFANLNLKAITTNIEERRNRVFLLMEEVRRLRIQQRLKEGELSEEKEEPVFNLEFPSAIPLVPPLRGDSLNKVYYPIFAAYAIGFIIFGGFVAPFLEPKLGIGGQSYPEFIESLGLPYVLSQVDPFVASFTGGAVGVITSLMVIEINNVKQQASKRCTYCSGSGYLACGTCSGRGLLIDIRRASTSAAPRAQPKCKCVTCSGSGKVMCTTCLCTGMALATEHDPRIDPFD
mmetsp:Transcript_39543/g.54902  ORF Transcript_39543/g.54902 Transcript_39543/m.54902 type:complete len:319 (+) Transcript_39543:127-1083(+)|eukprot:CAMPEP_0196570506 /NCGR_PEP_ID=MMETSP1081-20130531/632_1 /TAXON_ID=36882 /ORGANISM="Pyramimonas amylifera, Strain CCMP720" /LENGTH=318 /DNA_ID=CAMNT_0041886997 /DNA_START=121 /DNA_END=1077 /DNA_ORIENTATION=+